VNGEKIVNPGFDGGWGWVIVFPVSSFGRPGLAILLKVVPYGRREFYIGAGVKEKTSCGSSTACNPCLFIMPPQQTIQQTIDHLFRHESGKMVSVLSRLLGLQHMDIAQDIVQDTLLQAMTTWAYGNLPENPSAWLYRVARNRAIDHLRRERKFKEISPRYHYLMQSGQELSPAIDQLFLDFEIRDSQLRMIFVCCHPSIATESQVALSLKTLCGLSVSEIAKAFLTSEETIAKRIYRAREKIRAEELQLDHPPANELKQRLDAVLQSLYLLFNEGYNSSHPDRLIREELCEEAMRLTYLLTLQEKTNTGETKALLALMCFQASRLQARLDDRGAIVLLMHQDRSKWYRPLMDKGFAYLEAAMQTTSPLTAFAGQSKLVE